MPDRENESAGVRPAGPPMHPEDVVNAIHPEAAEGRSARRPSIVVGIDGSAESRAALHWSVRQAQDVGADVDAVAVWQQPMQFGVGALSPPPVPQKAFAAEARKWLADAVPELPRSTAGQVRVHTHIEHGDPVTVLLDYAMRADLLVLGNKGRGAIAGAVLGSVAHRCAHHARCPVVLVPTPPGPDSTLPR